jgi:alpha-glucosidase (family GH31 glycosyl hydrolase)
MLIPYYYTELSHIHEDGGAFYKPVYFSYPNEFGSYLEPQNNVMLGDALKLSIQSNKPYTDGNNSIYYFPGNTTWCNIRNSYMIGKLSPDTCFTTLKDG